MQLRWHPTKHYEVQIGWYEKSWKWCKKGWFKYPCSEKKWTAYEKTFKPEAHFLQLKQHI